MKITWILFIACFLSILLLQCTPAMDEEKYQEYMDNVIERVKQIDFAPTITNYLESKTKEMGRQENKMTFLEHVRKTYQNELLEKMNALEALKQSKIDTWEAMKIPKEILDAYEKEHKKTGILDKRIQNILQETIQHTYKSPIQIAVKQWIEMAQTQNHAITVDEPTLTIPKEPEHTFGEIPLQSQIIEPNPSPHETTSSSDSLEDSASPVQSQDALPAAQETNQTSSGAKKHTSTNESTNESGNESDDVSSVPPDNESTAETPDFERIQPKQEQ